MNNFIIGQYNFFDREKFKKDYREGFYGVEACMLESEDDISSLQAEAKKKNLNIGIHFPLRSRTLQTRDPLFLDLDADTRIQAFRAIEEELEFIKEKNINPQYILFHYPKPVILSEAFDLSRWRFNYNSEYVYESEYPFDKLIEYSEFLLQWLSEKSCEYNFTPVLEFDAINKYISENTYLEALLDKYNSIKVCLDIGRLHVQDRIDPEFNASDMLRRFSKYSEVIHLWHSKVGEVVEYGHFPLLPGLKPEDGWADVEAYFKVIRAENRNVKLLFEHRSDLITDDELEACYHWINELLNRGSVYWSEKKWRNLD
ncbi:MAG TPA: sugar phosphate isomerase/epimerase [Clostridia bacterium]|nr:sugar phosphate isomerase/epimerase [Clostridia bacterium]